MNRFMAEIVVSDDGNEHVVRDNIKGTLYSKCPCCLLILDEKSAKALAVKLNTDPKTIAQLHMMLGVSDVG